MIVLVMEQIKNSTNTLNELYLMEMWWADLWLLWKGDIVLLMLMVIHVKVNILSNFLHIHISFKKTWVLMIELSLLMKWYVKELFFESISIIIIMFCKEKSNNTIVSLREIINGYVKLLYYDSKHVGISSLYGLFYRNMLVHFHSYMYQWNNMII